MARLIEISPGRMQLRDKRGDLRFDSDDRMPFQWPAARVRKRVDVEWGFGPGRDLPADAMSNTIGGSGAYFRIYRNAHGSRDWDVGPVPAVRPFWWAIGKVRFLTLDIAGIGNDTRDRPQMCVPKGVDLSWTGGSIMVAEWLAQGSDYATWKWSWMTPMIVGRRFVLRLASAQVERRSQNFASPALVWQGARANASVTLDLQIYTWEGKRL